MICFENVSKTLGSQRVLANFDFQVSKGEKIAVIGPSGSGKSTFLRVIMALTNIDDGKVTLDGKVLWRSENGIALHPKSRAHLHEMRALVGLVFQSFNLSPNMTALHNVAAGPRHVLKLSNDAALKRAREMLEQVGLGDKLHNYPASMSGGQQQRVAIARAMAMQPRILLFDEPTSALDPERVGEVLNVMKMLAQSQELTIIVVTHQMAVASAIADRICFMEGGRIVEESTPATISDAEKYPRSSTFINSLL